MDTADASTRFLRQNARRIIVKIGTHTLAHQDGSHNAERIESLCFQIADLRKRGLEIIIVSSGAIGLGLGNLGMSKRPTDLATLQACAAVGQTILMQTWRNGFRHHDIEVGQVLLTHEDVRNRTRHLACRNTLERLIQLGVIPIINENDTVSAKEIRFGDNDMLSALTASLTNADLLILLSTIPGLLDRTGDGELVPVVKKITPAIEAMAGGSDSPLATGGMISKIAAAKVATRSGAGVFIGDGRNPRILLELANGNAAGTFFVPSALTLDAKRRWIAFFESSKGSLTVDTGAADALLNHGKSLLPKGLLQVEGQFSKGSVVMILSENGDPIARGIAQFDADQLRSIAGHDSHDIRSRFPASKRTEAVHRSSLVLL